MSDSPSTPPVSSSLLRANVIVAFGTFLSRITGFIRVLMLAAVFGFTGLSDVYNTANTTPNIIYELMLGGILSATLLPVLVRQFADEDSEGMSSVISIILIALFLLTIITMALAPWIIEAYAMSRTDDHASFVQVGTILAWFFLPQIFFYGVISLTTAVLNARRRFAAPAYAPVLNNLIVIAVLGCVAHLYPSHLDLTFALDQPSLLVWLGGGTTLGIVVSALVLIPQARAQALPFYFKPNWRHPAVQKVLRLSGWTLGYVLANQAALFFITTLALQHEGGLSAYQTAFTFFLLPHGLFAVSIMSTFSPDLAQTASNQLWKAHKAKIHQAIRIIVLLMLPASVGYVLVAEPLVNVFLQHGRFDAEDASLASGTLSMFALGLVPFSIYLFLLRSFYAMEDTRTVFYLNAVENILNVALAIPLINVLGVQGLALSYAIAYLLAAIITGIILGKRLGGLLWGEQLRALLPIMAAAGVMAMVVFAVMLVKMPMLMTLLIAVTGGATVYGAMLWCFAVPEFRFIANKLICRF